MGVLEYQLGRGCGLGTYTKDLYILKFTYSLVHTIPEYTNLPLDHWRWWWSGPRLEFPPLYLMDLCGDVWDKAN